MKKILFPFYSREKHSYLISKNWFKFSVFIFPILVLTSTLSFTQLFAEQSYLYCYDDLQRIQKQKTLDAAREINNLDFEKPGAELEVLQIKKRFNDWYRNKSDECRTLANENSKYLFPFGIFTLLASFYLIQFAFFRLVTMRKNKKM